MPNKTIISIIATTLLTFTAMMTHQPEHIIYAGFGIIASLGGFAIWRNNHPKS